MANTKVLKEQIAATGVAAEARNYKVNCTKNFMVKQVMTKEASWCFLPKTCTTMDITTPILNWGCPTIENAMGAP